MIEAIKYIYLDAPFIAKVALLLAAIFLYLAVMSLFFAIASRVTQIGYNLRKARLTKIFQTKLTELIYEEGDIPKRDVKSFKRRYLKNEEAKEILIEMLLDQQRNFVGDLETRIRYIYDAFGLQKEALKKLKSGHWYLIARGVRELGYLGDKSHSKKIEPFTNSRSYIVRRESQTALVQLNGIEGLSFLDDLKYQLAEWQQLVLFESLSKIEASAKPELARFLENKNSSVVSFALKLVGFFKLMQSAERVVELTVHDDWDVRINAIRALGRMEYFLANDFLLKHYTQQPLQVRIEILKVLSEIGTPDLVPFLLNEYKGSIFEISFFAAKALKELAPQTLQETAYNEDEYHFEIRRQFNSP